MGKGKLRPLRNRHPYQSLKTVTGVYIGDPHTCAKFGANPSVRAYVEMGEI